MLSNIICSLTRGPLENPKINFSNLTFVVLSHRLLSAAPLSGMLIFFSSKALQKSCFAGVCYYCEACAAELLYQDSQDGNIGSSLLQSSGEAFL